MSFLKSITHLLQDPPPAIAFELSEAGIAVARTHSKTELAFHAFKPGTISVSPLRDNIVAPEDLMNTVRAASPPNGNRKRRDAALILPDYCTRTAVLDFDGFPSDAKEQLSLIRFRMKKSVPFDVDGAAISYHPQHGEGKKYDVTVVIAPIEIVARYETPFRSVGLNPGLVTTSSMAALHLVDEKGVAVVAKLTGRALTVMVLNEGRLKLVRCLELSAVELEEIAADLYTTFVYIEDNLGTRAEKLLLCGFGQLYEPARQQLEAQLGLGVEPVRSPLRVPGENDAGLLGYLRSIGADK